MTTRFWALFSFRTLSTFSYVHLFAPPMFIPYQTPIMNVQLSLYHLNSLRRKYKPGPPDNLFYSILATALQSIVTKTEDRFYHYYNSLHRNNRTITVNLDAHLQNCYIIYCLFYAQRSLRFSNRKIIYILVSPFRAIFSAYSPWFTRTWHYCRKCRNCNIPGYNYVNYI